MVITDPTARLKMLAAIALAEAEDGHGDPDAVIPYLGKIATEDLMMTLVATKYCIIELHIVKELGAREDMSAKKFMELTSTTEHVATQKALCEAAAKFHATKNLPLSIEEFNSLSASGIGGPIKAVVERALRSVPKGDLPEFLSQTFESTQYLIVNEFIRRNDPIGEGLLKILDMKIARSTWVTIIDMIRRDPRITPDHLLSVKNTEAINRIFYEKIKNAPLANKIEWYRKAKESFQPAIIVSLEKDVPEVLSCIDTLIELTRTSAAHAMVIRILGKYVPIEKLLELRDRTADKTVTEAFSEIFGVRYKELQKFLTS